MVGAKRVREWAMSVDEMLEKVDELDAEALARRQSALDRAWVKLAETAALPMGRP